jgi:hypothetical protein
MLSMRDFLRSSGRWLGAGWYWPLILLALPACGLATGGIPNPNAFDPGTGDLSSAVMCDIVKPTEVVQCATGADFGNIMSKDHAAVALADGTHGSFALDFSADAIKQCSPFPRKVEFFGPFPDGTPVCLNCAQQIPATFSGPAAVCVAKCKELVSASFGTPTEGLDAYCAANARPSTNFSPSICFTGACTTGGNPVPGFVDPRWSAELVKWSAGPEMIGTSNPSGSDLQRDLPTTGPATTDFNAGAASEQLITSGDAWVEFGATETGTSHVIGVRESCKDISQCPDTDPSLADIGFAISLNADGQVYALESTGTPTPVVMGGFGPYAANERFRVHLTDNHDGTATITYNRVVGTCTPHIACNETQMAQHVGANPKYPFRIDASFREQGAIVVNPTVMRIITQ